MDPWPSEDRLAGAWSMQLGRLQPPHGEADPWRKIWAGSGHGTWCYSRAMDQWRIGIGMTWKQVGTVHVDIFVCIYIYNYIYIYSDTPLD